MRIRKHAKISQLLDTTSSLNSGTVLQTYVCQLNQSPWDVMNFSPPSSPLLPPPTTMTQADTADTYGGNVGSDRHVSVDERKIKNGNDNGVMVLAVSDDKKEQCCKTDGKSWRCRREAAAGSSLCTHHLSLVKNYQNLGQNTARKCKKPGAETRHSTRSKKKAAVPSSNAHEFYYYSGFRPGWSKNRDQTSRTNGASGMAKKLEESKINYEEEEEEDDDELIDSEEDEYNDEDEEYNDDEISRGINAGKRKKRNRKPVKARSLKSLM